MDKGFTRVRFRVLGFRVSAVSEGPYRVSPYSSNEEELVGHYGNETVCLQMEYDISGVRREDYKFNLPSNYTRQSRTGHYAKVPLLRESLKTVF